VNVRATRFPLFDSLRAIAAIAVLGTHAGVSTNLYTGHSTLGQYVSRLDVGVAVFFLISGFLLYRPFVRAHVRDEPAPATGPYAWRRFLRIVPAYWVALTVTTIWLGASGVFNLEGIARYYGYAQIYSDRTIGSGMAQAWTLCVEITFYVFLPVWALLMRRVARGWRAGLRAETVGVAFLFCFSIVWTLVVLSQGNSHIVHLKPELVALPAYLDHFALGMGLAILSVWLERRDGLPAVLRPFDRFPALAWAAAAVAFWAVATQIGTTARFFEPYSNLQYMERHVLYGVVALGLILPAVVGDQTRGVVRKILANRVLLYLGVISYGIYLYGGAATVQLDRWGLTDQVASWQSRLPAYLVVVATALVFTVLIASVSWFVLERPLLRLKGLVGGPRTPPGEALAEPAAVRAPAGRAG
jgi:peptidoglycan/LPS O-acetylase OafA/YrhL